MRSVNSYFNPTLYTKNVTRYWPVWALYTVILIFALPVNGWLVGQGYNASTRALRVFDFGEETVLELAAEMSVPMALIFGILGAMAVFSYLYQSRSAGMLHSQPIRREGLFLTNYLSGLSFFLVPNLVVAVITAGVESAMGHLALAPIVTWLVVQSATVLFFYSFGVFCAMFTGHILALPAFYFILNFLVSFVTMLMENLLRNTLFGFAGFNGWSTVSQWLTPVNRLMNALAVYDNTEYLTGGGVGPAGYVYEFFGLETALIYGAVGLVFAVVALLCYRRHRVESAGDVVSVSWVYALFKYGVTFCVALSFGTLLHAVFSFALSDSGWSMLGFILLCAVVGYFGAEMLLKKTFRVWGAWRGCVVALVCLTALIASLELDIYGFESRVPTLSQVEYVTGVGTYSAPYDGGNRLDDQWTDPQEVAAILAIHQAIIDEQGLSDRALAGALSDGAYAEVLPSTVDVTGELRELYISTLDYARFTVCYYLADGSVVERNYYNVVVTPDQLAQEGTAAALLEHFINTPDNVARAYSQEKWDFDGLTEVSVDVFDRSLEGGIGRVEIEGTELQQELLEAVMADFAEGNLGQRYLLTDGLERYQNSCYNDIRLKFLDKSDGDWTTRTYTITPTPQAEHTIDVLTRAGVLNETASFVTHQEYELWQMEQELG